ncbi:hypothetical protein DKX38_018529 [Salix brachista]|uniref:Uncharacterized protein n=1 Tax=Salix brachista TaxID=2182728 RepID=A0A5N5KNA1_9ROSI|nr:hypothetical protein DKX38_018529 [Salix brachista]
MGTINFPWLLLIATFMLVLLENCVISAENCARRRWINLDIDIIACTYPNLQYTQLLIMFVSEFNYFPMFSVEKGALVISLKLNGHKLSCPLIDNASPQMISSSAIEYVRCHQLEEFLRQSPKLENGNGSANLSQIQFFVNDSDADSANLYYKVQYFFSFVSNITVCVTFSCHPMLNAAKQ